MHLARCREGPNLVKGRSGVCGAVQFATSHRRQGLALAQVREASEWHSWDLNPDPDGCVWHPFSTLGVLDPEVLSRAWGARGRHGSYPPWSPLLGTFLVPYLPPGGIRVRRAGLGIRNATGMLVAAPARTALPPSRGVASTRPGL